MDDRLHARIESIRIRGFRSLADVKVTDLPPVAVLIGANGSGKSNVMCFFEMLGWMLRSSRLGDFVQMLGGADDQLFHGRRRTPQMEAELRLATELGHTDYRFVLAHAHPDRLIFLEEAYRFSNRTWGTLADWQYVGSGHAEAGIVTASPGHRLRYRRDGGHGRDDAGPSAVAGHHGRPRPGDRLARPDAARN